MTQQKRRRLAGQGADHLGIVFWAQQTRAIGDIVEGLILLYEVFNPDEMIGQIEYL